MKFSRLIKKYFKSTEELVSMFLGLVIVVVVVGLIYNYIQKGKGNTAVPGISDINISEEDFITKDGTVVDGKDVYVVEKNDSLWKIAVERYNDGFAWTEIAKINNLKNASLLEAGQKIVLPKIEKKEIVVDTNKETTISTTEYKVLKNDSLWKIAVRTYGDGYQWTKIWQENKSKLNNPNNLEIGMILNLPSLK